MQSFATLLRFLPLILGLVLGGWQYSMGETAGWPVVAGGLLFLLALQSVLTIRRRAGRDYPSEVQPSVAPLTGSHEESTADSILEALAGGVLTVNPQGRILYLNGHAKYMIGLETEKGVGEPVEKILNLEDAKGKPLVQRVMELHKAHPQHLLQFGQVKLLPKTGEPCFVELHTTCIEDGERGLVFIFRDVTADRKVINRIYQQAAHDALTGLMNRRSFEDYLEQVAHDDSGVLRANVLATIDLDNFKVVNDTCGHQAGDELLKQIAQIFQRAVRKADKVARLGGDEFAILLEGCPVDKARKIMDSVLLEIRNHRFSWEGKVFNVTTSIGLIEFVPGSELSVKMLFSNADKACYTAKALGRNQTFVHISSDESYHSEQRHTDWGKLLEKAMDEGRFILFVQPIVPLQAHRRQLYSHYEILLRLPFRRHLLSPGSFLPAADRLDMMGRIDRWIIRKVVELLSENSLSGKSGLTPRLMVNLSAQAVQDPDLYAYIDATVREFGVDPSVLCFEIAESVAISNFMQTRRLMKSLFELGCHLVLDDFGSGFSSLNYVRDLPLSYLKIDGNFVHNLVSNAVDAAMVKAVHEVGQVMQLLTIAELVEDEQTLTSLHEIGVDFAQGYHCGKPFPFMHLCEQGIDHIGTMTNQGS